MSLSRHENDDRAAPRSRIGQRVVSSVLVHSRDCAGTVGRKECRIDGDGRERKGAGCQPLVAHPNIGAPFAVDLVRHHAGDPGGAHVRQRGRRSVERHLDSFKRSCNVAGSIERKAGGRYGSETRDAQAHDLTRRDCAILEAGRVLCGRDEGLRGLHGQRRARELRRRSAHQRAVVGRRIQARPVFRLCHDGRCWGAYRAAQVEDCVDVGDEHSEIRVTRTGRQALLAGPKTAPGGRMQLAGPKG